MKMPTTKTAKPIYPRAVPPMRHSAAGDATRARIVAFIAAYQREHGYAPTYREIGADAGIAVSVVHHHLAILVSAGRVRYNPHSPRTITVVQSTPGAQP